MLIKRKLSPQADFIVMAEKPSNIGPISMRILFLLPLLFVTSSGLGSDPTESYIVILKYKSYREASRHPSFLKTVKSKAEFRESSVLRHDLLLGNLEGQKTNDYYEIADGFSARLTKEDVERLKGNPQVLFVAKDSKRQLLTTQSFNFLGLNNATNGIWRKTTGASTIVGVIDSGIWPESLSFSDKGFGPPPSKFKGQCEAGADASFKCNRKLIGARYFGDSFAQSYGRDLQSLVEQCGDSLSPRDLDGHGTHTASTAAGSVVSRALLQGVDLGSPHGVAYSARLAAYKVFWCGGEATTADILAAMEAGVADGVDVLSLSLGGGPDLQGYSTLDPLQYFAYLATLEGVAVVFAGGNSGPEWFTVSNAAPWILTVGASSIDRQFPASAVLGSKATIQGASVVNPGTPKASSKQFYPLISSYIAFASSQQRAELCYNNSLSAAKVRGRVVLCKRGEVPLEEKVEAVRQAGGVGLVMFNQMALGDSLPAVKTPFPFIAVSHSSGVAIKTYIASTANPKVYIAKSSAIAVGGSRVEAPQVADFSSLGPSGGSFNIIKPDVVAPGVNILAAVSQASGGAPWDIYSGTSMAAPHVAGVVALLKALHPSWPLSHVFSAIKTSATQLTNRRKPIYHQGRRAHPFSMGSGHIDPNSAADPGLVYPISNAGYSKFLCSPDSGLGSEYASVDWALFCPSYPSTRAVDLNLPSVSFYRVKAGGSAKTLRVLRNVGPAATYTALFGQPAGATLKVTPSKLVFGRGQALSFNLTVVASEASARVKGAFFTNSTSKDSVQARLAWSSGSLVWADNKGHRVRIPVVVNAV